LSNFEVAHILEEEEEEEEEVIYTRPLDFRPYCPTVREK